VARVCCDKPLEFRFCPTCGKDSLEFECLVEILTYLRHKLTRERKNVAEIKVAAECDDKTTNLWRRSILAKRERAEAKLVGWIVRIETLLHELALTEQNSDGLKQSETVCTAVTCCGKTIEVRFCPVCGEDCMRPDCLVDILKYFRSVLKGFRVRLANTNETIEKAGHKVRSSDSAHDKRVRKGSLDLEYSRFLYAKENQLHLKRVVEKWGNWAARLEGIVRDLKLETQLAEVCKKK